MTAQELYEELGNIPIELRRALRAYRYESTHQYEYVEIDDVCLGKTYDETKPTIVLKIY